MNIKTEINTIHYFFALLNLHHNRDLVSNNFSVIFAQGSFNISGVKISGFQISG